MRVASVKTSPVRQQGDILAFLDEWIPALEDRTIVVITSKVVSILEGSVREKTISKENLIKQEADYYIEDEWLWKHYRLFITRKNDIIIANAGIDESNANDRYVLWPRNPFETAERVWRHLKTKHALLSLGIIISDSRITPLRWGTIGIGIAWCGFQPLNDYRGTPDIFGRSLRVTKAGILDGLAASAVLVMGEGKEQTPIAMITDIPFVTFVDHPPTKEEQQSMRIDIKDDIYAPLLTAVPWEKGNK